MDSSPPSPALHRSGSPLVVIRKMLSPLSQDQGMQSNPGYQEIRFCVDAPEVAPELLDGCVWLVLFAGKAAKVLAGQKVDEGLFDGGFGTS